MNTRKMKYFRPVWVAVVIGLGVSAVAWSMPPHPNLLESNDPLAKKSVVLYDSLRSAAAAKGMDQPDPALARPTAPAALRPVVILVEFSDHASGVAATYFDSLIFGQTTQTVWDYFQEVSYGTFSLDAVDLPSAIGWQTAPQTYAYYTNGNSGMGTYPQNTQKLTEDLIALIDDSVDFSQYDADLDGFVDGIIIVHSGTGAESSGSPDDIWSHQWGIDPQVRDGKIIRTYSIQPEFWDSAGDMTIGVYCHELGHALFGLPDLYDTDGDSRGLGRWSLMASGSWGGSMGNLPAHPDGWSRARMGFVTPTIIASALEDYPIPAIEDSARVFKLWTDGGPIGDEYYLVENRQKTGYDVSLPSSGLCIYHIDDTVTSGNDQQWYPGYTSNGHYLVALEQADGDWDLEQNVLSNYGDNGDPFPGSADNRIFTAASTPSSDAYDGTETYVVVADISNSAAIMTADFHVVLGSGIMDEQGGQTPGAFTLGQNYPNPFNPRTRFSYSLPEAGFVEVEVYNVLGRKVRTLWSGDQPSGTHHVGWNGDDERRRPAPGGVYFYRVTSAQQIKTGKMVLLK